MLLPLAWLVLAMLGVSLLAARRAPSRQSGAPPPDTPDFRLSLAPEVLVVRRGGTGRVGVKVEPVNGLAGRVDLLSSLLYETRTTFTPPALASGAGTSELEVAPSATAIKGSYVVSVTAVCGGITHSVLLRLTIK